MQGLTLEEVSKHSAQWGLVLSCDLAYSMKCGI